MKKIILDQQGKEVDRGTFFDEDEKEVICTMLSENYAYQSNLVREIVRGTSKVLGEFIEWEAERQVGLVGARWGIIKLRLPEEVTMDAIANAQAYIRGFNIFKVIRDFLDNLEITSAKIEIAKK